MIVAGLLVQLARLHFFHKGSVDMVPDSRAVVHHEIAAHLIPFRNLQAVKAVLVRLEDIGVLPQRCGDQDLLHASVPLKGLSPTYTGTWAICPGRTVGSHQISRPSAFTRQQNARSSP